MPYRTGNYWLQLTIFVSCWFRALEVVLAVDVNVTVDDTHPTILYLPSNAWQSNYDGLCTSCSDIDPTFIRNASYHFVLPQDSRRRDRRRRSTSSSSLKRNLPIEALASIGRHSLDPTRPHKLERPQHGSHERRSPVSDDDANSQRDRSSRRKPPRDSFADGESGDGDFLSEISATLRFEFIGSAIYLFGVQPTSSSTTPSSTVVFEIDGTRYPQPPLQDPRASSPYNATLFVQTGLSEGPHALTVTVGDGSEFLFDYLVYTQSKSPSGVHQFMALPPNSATSEPTASSNSKKNVTTFAAAVGGSVGVLAILSAGLAISLIRRRYLARKRERENREGDPNDPERIRQQQMAMAGPDVFIPRFFPGTEIPPGDPPTYHETVNADRINAGSHPISPGAPGPPASGNGSVLPNHIAYPYLLSMGMQNYPYLHHPPPLGSPVSQLSYADIPPDSPPPPPDLVLNDDDDDHGLDGLGGRRVPDTPPPPPPLPLPFPEPTQVRHVDVGVGGTQEDLAITPQRPPALVLDGPSHPPGIVPQGRLEHQRSDSETPLNPTTGSNSGAAPTVPVESVPLLNQIPHSNNSSSDSIPLRRTRSASR
ncbi:hypothetical protein CC2G_002563 [Coprinopsis cinerea AmutBmut pab1-1]|nr:hypothetical protein CC2G_002563 [Coprinopsis cinerea AmutBmut pab1-1]